MGGVGVETGRSGAELPVRRVMPREREQEPRCWTIQSQTERRDRGQTEKSWLLFEGVDTSLYDLMRKSKNRKKTRATPAGSDARSSGGGENHGSCWKCSNIGFKRRWEFKEMTAATERR